MLVAKSDYNVGREAVRTCHQELGGVKNDNKISFSRAAVRCIIAVATLAALNSFSFGDTPRGIFVSAFVTMNSRCTFSPPRYRPLITATEKIKDLSNEVAKDSRLEMVNRNNEDWIEEYYNNENKDDEGDLLRFLETEGQMNEYKKDNFFFYQNFNYGDELFDDNTHLIAKNNDPGIECFLTEASSTGTSAATKTRFMANKNKNIKVSSLPSPSGTKNEKRKGSGVAVSISTDDDDDCWIDNAFEVIPYLGVTYSVVLTTLIINYNTQILQTLMVK